MRDAPPQRPSRVRSLITLKRNKRSDFCERKNPTLGFLHPQKSDEGRINCVPPPVGGGAIYALGIGPVRGANSDSPSESSLANSGAIRSDGRKNPSAYYALVRSFSVGRIICVPHGANYALGIRDRDREFRLSASQSASRRLRTPF